MDTKTYPYTILYVDDEEKSLKYFEKSLSKDFHILTAPCAKDAWSIIEEKSDQIAILLTDQRMPGETGVELLQRVHAAYPRIIRILVTAYTDIDSAIAAVNNGAIYRYISKPWDMDELHVDLLRAMEHFIVLLDRDQLLGEKLSVMQRLVSSDRSKALAILALGVSPYLNNAIAGVDRFLAALPAETDADVDPSTAWRNFESLAADECRCLLEVVRTIQAGGSYGDAEAVDILLTRVLETAGLGGDVAVDGGADLPAIRVDVELVGAMVRRIVEALRPTGSDEAAVTIRCERAQDNGGSAAILFAFDDGTPEWTAERRGQVLSAGDNGGVDGGMIACFLIAAHHGGTIDVPGGADTKIRVLLPVDPCSGGDSKLPDEGELMRFFRHQHAWQDPRQ